MRKLFTERRDGGRPRTAETLDATTKQELLLVVYEKYSANWFGFAFPETCPDGDAHVAGTNDSILRKKLKAYNLPLLRGLEHLEESEFPSDDVLFDLMEFSYETIAAPKVYEYHSFFNHDHYSYDQIVGRATFADDVNRIFERRGIGVPSI